MWFQDMPYRSAASRMLGQRLDAKLRLRSGEAAEPPRFQILVWNPRYINRWARTVAANLDESRQ